MTDADRIAELEKMLKLARRLQDDAEENAGLLQIGLQKANIKLNNQTALEDSLAKLALKQATYLLALDEISRICPCGQSSGCHAVDAIKIAQGVLFRTN